MILENILDRYGKLDKSHPPAVPASIGDLLPFLRVLVQESPRQYGYENVDRYLDRLKFDHKWDKLSERLRERHYCPSNRNGLRIAKRDRCQGPHCSAALDQFGKWDSWEFTDAVNDVWDEDLKMMCLLIISNMYNGRLYRQEVQVLHHVLPSFRHDIKEFSTSLLKVHQMTSGITEPNCFQYSVEKHSVERLFERLRLLVVLISNLLSRRLHDYDKGNKKIEPEHIKDLFLQMKKDMAEMYEFKSPVFRFMMGWNVEEVLLSVNTDTTMIQLYHPDIVWRHFHDMNRYTSIFSGPGKEVKRFYEVSAAVIALHQKTSDLRRDGFFDGLSEVQDRIRGLTGALERAALKLAAIVVFQRAAHKGSAGPMNERQENLFKQVVMGVNGISTAAKEEQQNVKDLEKRLRKQRRAQHMTPGPRGYAGGW